MNQSTKLMQKLKSDNFGYRKVGRAITNWGAIESNIAIAISGKLQFLNGNKIISHFNGSNNIFADCKQLCLYNVHINVI